ncbi:MAG: hypothetical protein ACKVP0_18225 [Pirellulaceae bacterium]
MYRILYSLTLVGTVLALAIATAEDKVSVAKKPPAKEARPPEGKIDDKNPSIWMKKKLDYSQNILAGITAEDFDKIADNARAMKGLGKFEAFVRSRNAAYTRQLQVFDEINDEMIRQADNDNVEGVTLAFTQLTVNCVNCHKVLRHHAKSGGAK